MLFRSPTLSTLNLLLAVPSPSPLSVTPKPFGYRPRYAVSIWRLLFLRLKALTWAVTPLTVKVRTFPSGPSFAELPLKRNDPATQGSGVGVGVGIGVGVGVGLGLLPFSVFGVGSGSTKNGPDPELNGFCSCSVTPLFSDSVVAELHSFVDGVVADDGVAPVLGGDKAPNMVTFIKTIKYIIAALNIFLVII